MKTLKVLIDPGHGGIDPGAVGGNLKEKDINLAVALLLAQRLQQDDRFVTSLTRFTDSTVALSRRIDVERKFAADVFISLHCNSSNNVKAKGIEVFTYFGQSKADVLAELILQELKHVFPNRVFRTDTTDNDLDKEANLYVLRKTKAPAVLVEMEFISNKDGRQFLSSTFTQTKLASAIHAALISYLEAI